MLDGLYIDRTYAGCYEGVLSPDSVMDMAKTRAAQLWGKHVPILLLDPKIVERGKARLLPRWRFMLYLSDKALSKERDGSHLIVIAFGDEPLFDVQPFLDRFTWAEHAEDFDY